MNTSRGDLRAERDDEMSFVCGPALASMYKLSPYVWSDADGYGLLLRVVNADRDATKKVARIHAGRSQDGLRFALDNRSRHRAVRGA